MDFNDTFFEQFVFNYYFIYMIKILIIGGGFAGISAAKKIYRLGLNLDVTLIDKKDTTDFLPLLPDCIGRGVNPVFLSYKIENISRKLKFKFIKDEVISIDLDKRQVFTKTKVLDYDYLLICSGAETNFYGNENIKQNAFTLDSVNDVIKILNALRKNEFDNFIIGGGGYTGIEVATNLRIHLKKIRSNNRIVIVERTPQILGTLPETIKNYVRENLKRLNIDVYLNSTIERIEEQKVYLSSNTTFNNAMVVWTVGVKTPDFVQNLKLEKNSQGRVKVDEYLRINDNSFAAGDVSLFNYKENFLRMAVQFAINQGECAAYNIINSIKGKGLRAFEPYDLGYIIPMANNHSYGIVLGFNIKGYLPTFLHFVMCIYRSYGIKNKFGVIGNLIK